MAKMPMKKNPKTGQMVPEFAMDGKGSGDLKKAKAGGSMKKTKGYSKGGITKKKVGGAMKPAKKMNQGSRRRPAPVEEPKYKDPLLQALEEERRIQEANEPKPKKKMGGGAMKKTKGYSKGGAMKKTKGYSKGGAMKKTKGYSRGGVARGMGAATKGGNFTRGG